MKNEEAITIIKKEFSEYKDTLSVYAKKRKKALEMAIKALGQESITWIAGKDNCQVAVRNMPIDKMQKICAIIGEEEQQPIDKSAMMYEIYMEGVNMTGEYQGCWVRFNNIEKIVNKYMGESEDEK